MAAGKKIAVFPEPGAIGPVMNLVGICQGLRERGHECVFVLDPGLAGTVKGYGFEEQYISCMAPMSPEESAKYWNDFMLKYLPSFRTSPYDQISTYVKGCWEAIADTSRWSVRNGLGDVLRGIRPDLIINDNVALYPDTERVGCPWVRMISCSENEVIDPEIPPHLSGCGEADRACFARYRKRFEEVIKPIHDDFMDFIASCGHERIPFPEFVLPSPYLNLLLYPEPLRFKRSRPLDPEKFVYLDGCVRKESEAYQVPRFAKNEGAPLIYFSFGSLGVSDVDLIKRMIDAFGRAPYRVLANVGAYLDQYGDPPGNVKIASWYPQTAVIPHCDVVIQHGGNNTFMETLYFGKAPLIMPFVWDGHDNAQRVNDTGHGIGMHRYEWTDEQLLGNIERLLSDAVIQKRLAETSAFMQAHDGRATAAQRIDALLASLG
ncbi:MAG: glycosyltransferase [Myxococcales bacterium]|nr:glycosyltransferase [Myxococcales bacterium]MDH5305830.1 glycosyltransferase [Myxococcales bacterium]MDH5565843.1 glycosyltransferase [Myxococcales bacterium]